MKAYKHLIALFALILAHSVSFCQISGGSGIMNVTQDPNSIGSIQSPIVGVDAVFAYWNGKTYAYDSSKPAGSKWVELPTSLTGDTDTRLDAPFIQNDSLKFVVRNKSGTGIGYVGIPRSAINTGATSVNGLTGVITIDLSLSADSLSISGDLSKVSLSQYKQTLSYNPFTRELIISNGNGVFIPQATAATSTLPGVGGLLPAAPAGSDTKFLRGDMTYVDVSVIGSDDQTAAEVPSTPSGSVTATNVQVAINQLSGFDPSNTNELQTISSSGASGNITLSNGGGTLTLNVNDADASPTNEIQTIGLSGQSLSISGANNVTLPVVGISAGTNVTIASASGVYTINATGGGGGGGIDTLSNYSVLRTYSDPTKHVVVVQDFSYVFNDIAYTTKGGVFYRVASGTENGGETIAGVFTWKRLRTGIEVYPEWWQVGSFDVDGTTNPTRFTTNGVFNDRDRAAAAHRFAGVNGVIVYGLYVKRYDIETAIPVFDAQSIYANRTLFFRPNSPRCVSTSSIVGTTSFTVNDASQFRVGQTIVSLDTSNTRGDATHIDGRSFAETTIDAVIAAISGNTITLSAPFLQPGGQGGGFGNIGVGQRIIRTGGIFQACVETQGVLPDRCNYFAGGEGQNYYDLVIDGNRSNGGNGEFPVGYNLNLWSILPGNGARFTNFTRCIFRNAPTENMLGTLGMILNCHFRNMGGSAFHYVEGTPTTIARKPNTMSVIGCTFDSICMATNARTNHGEAIILVSNNSEWGDVSGNTFRNCPEAIFSFAPGEQTPNFDLQTKIRFSNNYAENCRFILGTIDLTSYPWLYQQRSVILNNNTFWECGDIWLDGTDLTKGKGFASVQLNHNTIVGGRIFIRNSDQVQITGNNIVFHSEHHNNPFRNRVDARDYWSAYSLDYFNTNASAVCVRISRNVNISGNIIEGFESQNDSLLCGINVAPEWFGNREPRMKNSSGVELDYYYMQNVVVHNNIIANFPYGISGFTRPGRNINTGLGEGFIAQGWKFSDNTVYMNKAPIAAQATWGIYAQSGTDVINNRVYKQSTESDDFPFIYQGLETASGFNTFATKYVGWRIANNLFDAGSTTAVAVRIGDPTNNWNQGNISGVDNTLIGTLQAGAAFSNSYWVNPIMVNSTNFPLLTNKQRVLYNSFKLNKTQY